MISSRGIDIAVASQSAAIARWANSGQRVIEPDLPGAAPQIEALYIAPTHRHMGLAHRLLNRAYNWAEAQGLARVQLYVTASNERAQSVYSEQGFTITQAIMRKTLN